jgi:DNA-binding transcriptional LysR family regulator
VWLFHLAFAVLCVVVLLAARDRPGPAILGLTLGYNIGLPWVCSITGDRDSLALWRFLLPLSVFMVLPDAFLAAHLGVLEFPDTGSPYLGPVPLFMAGLWVIPLFLTVKAGERRGAAGAALAALVIFTAAEATLWAVPVWHARDVAQIGHVAVYLLVPETILGVSTWLAWRASRYSGPAVQALSAAAVMVLYLGNCALFWFVLESPGGL